MTNRHRRTLAAIFERPTRKDIRFNKVANLLEALGAVRRERAGSRVAFTLRGRVLLLHRPHNPPVMRAGAVKDLRDFLVLVGIGPPTDEHRGKS